MVFTKRANQKWLNEEEQENSVLGCRLEGMAIRFVEFLPKNQHTQRKLLNFENWISGGLRSFQESEF